MYPRIVILIFLSTGMSVCRGKARSESEQILYISHDTLRLYNVLWKNASKISKHLQHLIEVDYHFETQTIFYIIDSNTINRTSLITKDVQRVLTTDTNDIHHMAVDWVTKKIYFTGQNTKRIEVCNFDGSQRRVLYQKPIGDPFGIAVSPKHGLMFYTDVGDNPTIGRFNMDGTDGKELITEGIHYPATITVDPDQEFVYWLDYWKKNLGIMDLDGQNIRSVAMATTGYSHFTSLTIVGAQIFMAYEGEKPFSGHLMSCNQINGSFANCQTVLSKLDGNIAIRAYGKSHQKYKHSACQRDNGGCSHLCLLNPTPRGYACTCPTGLKLKSDRRTCNTEMEKFILYCTKRHLRVISLDTEQRIDLTLPMKHQHTVFSVDYDPVDKMIYWTEIFNSDNAYIRRAYLDGTGIETVVPVGFTSSDHLAIDWIARNLYWTCPVFNKIYVSSLDGSEIIVIVDTDLEEPRGVAVDPGDGRLYWSDWGSTNPKIESADLDGTNRVILVNESLQWPNGVAIDYQRRRLYWVDAGTDKIEYFDLVRKTRHSSPGSPHPFGVSILGDWIYWTDWQDRSLHKLNLISEERGFVVREIPDIMGMKAIDTTLRYGNNDCQNNSHGCSHFCFHKPRVGAVCACPDGYVLDDNKKGCIALSGYLFYATESYINALSLDRPKTISAVPKITDNAISLVETHVKSNQVFWANNSADGHSASAIKSSLINDTSKVRVIQTGFYGPMGGIAIDWISGNVYWSQQTLKRIEVSRLDGRYRTTLIESKRGIKGIKSVAINPRLRKLYWFEVYKSHESRLIVSDLDGTKEKVIVNITGEPEGLVIDYNDSRIYWVVKNSIESIDPNGRDRKLIADSLGCPCELAIFKDRLYLCEQERPHEAVPSISSVIKYDGSKKVVLKSGSGGIWFQDISVHHTSLQIGENICDRRNGGCKQLCFATSMKHRICSCEMHYQLDKMDNVSCIGPRVFMLLSEMTVVYRVLLHAAPEVPINFNSLVSVRSIEYDINSEHVYWLDAQTRQIKWLSHSRRVQTLPLNVESASPVSFVIDFFTRILYWVNKNTNAIMFMNLADTDKKGVIFQNEKFHPRKLAILPEKGLLFFVNEYRTDTGKGFDSIEYITLAGTNLKLLKKFNEKKELEKHEKIEHGQYDIAVDQARERLYYLHRPLKRIESISVLGGEVRPEIKFNPNQVTPVAIAVYGDYFYWLDIDSNTGFEKLKWRSIHRYKGKKIYNNPRIFENTKDLLIVDLDRKNIPHPCKVNNGGCSHICYVGKNRTQAQCACPLGWVKHTRMGSKTCHECTIGDHRCRLVECKRFMAMCEERADMDCSEALKNQYADCTQLFRINSTTTITPVVTDRRPHDHHRNNRVNNSVAGIVSGCVLTTLVLGCVMFVFCRLQHKKLTKLRKQEQEQVFLQKEECKFEANNESVFVLPETFRYKSLETVTDSIPPTNCSTEMTNFRYITGSSTKLDDSVIMPFNPPPSAISSNLEDISVCASNAFSSDMFQTVDLPVPPSTPLYTPSEMESTIDGQSSILSNACPLTLDKGASLRAHSSASSHDPASLRGQQACAADWYAGHQNCMCYKKEKANERYMRFRSRLSVNRPTPSLASSYMASLRRPINSHNSCGSSIDSRRRQSLTRQLSHISSIADSIVDGGGGHLPSLASGEYTSSSSVSSQKTIQHISENYEADSNVFNSYAPPPSPREMHPFQDLKGDTAYEVAFLLEESPEQTVASNSIENF